MVFLEEIQMNALPSLKTIVFDGWFLRFSNGYSRRGNSVFPLFDGKCEINEKIRYCESIYTKENLKTIFRITEENKDLDLLLEKLDYQIESPTNIMTMNLDEIPLKIDKDIIIFEELNEVWFDSYCRLNDVKDENKKTYKNMLLNLILKAIYVMIVKDGVAIACGLSVLEREYAGIYDITTDINYRRCGYGEIIVKSLLSKSKRLGVKKSYLQVFIHNDAAIKLYEKIGYKNLYHYHYRVKNLK